MTNVTDVVRMVWDMRINQVTSLKKSKLPAAMAKICPTNVVWFELPKGCKPLICSEDTPVPNQTGLSIGDILEEELDVTIPYGSLVALLPGSAYESDTAVMSRHIGQLMTDVIIKRVQAHNADMARESSIIMSLCRSLQSSLTQNTLNGEPHKIDSIAYIYGVADSLSSHFAGFQNEKQDVNNIFYRFDVLSNSETDAYISLADPCYDPSYKATFAHMAQNPLSPEGIEEISEALSQAEQRARPMDAGAF